MYCIYHKRYIMLTRIQWSFPWPITWSRRATMLIDIYLWESMKVRKLNTGGHFNVVNDQDLNCSQREEIKFLNIIIIFFFFIMKLFYHVCLYFTILLLLLYTKTVQWRLHTLLRPINTTFSTRQLLYPTYYKESILHNF